MEPVQIGLMVSILSGVCTAFWTVLTWNQKQEKDEEIRRNKNAALYVNPFLLAAEDLQVRLYNFLTGKKIKTLDMEAYAGFSADALEILYVIIIYFGWSFVIYRYGPYTRDKKVIELVRTISEVFAEADDYTADDAFYFSLPEQRSLGLTFVRPVNPVNLLQQPDSLFSTYEATSLFEFEEEIKSQRSEHSALYTNIRDALHLIDDFEAIEDLEGYNRLVIIQNSLVDLLKYLESKEGFSVSVKERRKAMPLKGTMIKTLGQTSPRFEVVHHVDGRIRLRISDLKRDPSYADQIKILAHSFHEVIEVRVNLPIASVTIEYDPVISKPIFEQQITMALDQANT